MSPKFARRPMSPAVLRTAAALTVALGCVLSSRPAAAQWIVSDPATELSTAFTQVSTTTSQIEAASEYVQTAVRWKATWDHYYQQIARFMSMVRNPTLSSKVSFSPVPLDFGVQEKCGGTGGFSFSLSSLANTLVPDFNGNIMENQRKICAQIQMLENQKYNATVRYVQEIAPSLKQDLENIDQQRRANNEQGTLQAIQEASLRLQNQQKLSEDELTTQVKSCDTLIAALTEMQKNLARQALKGKPDPVIGTLVKTATLEAALKAK